MQKILDSRAEAPIARVQDAESTVDVYLLPLDDFPADLASRMADRLSRDLQLRVRASLPMGSADVRTLPGTHQLIAESIIDQAAKVGARLPSRSSHSIVIAMTSRDMNSADHKVRFTFASHDNTKRVAVVSIARMSFAKYPAGLTGKTSASQSDVDMRLYKMLKRAVGESYFGYTRSSNINDVMYSPLMSLNDLDAIGTDFVGKYH
jgi:hypothetical protein